MVSPRQSTRTALTTLWRPTGGKKSAAPRGRRRATWRPATCLRFPRQEASRACVTKTAMVWRSGERCGTNVFVSDLCSTTISGRTTMLGTFERTVGSWDKAARRCEGR